MVSGGTPTVASWRLAALGLLMAAGLLLLAVRLYRVQVLGAPFYAGAAERQSVRRVLLPGSRGRILDRQRRGLADNRPSYSLAVYIEELRQPGRWSNTVNAVDRELDRLSAVLRLPRASSAAEIATHVRRRLPLPFLAWEDVDAAALARFAESLPPFPGVDIYVQPERVYPGRSLAAHVLGYVGRDRPAATNEPYHYYVTEMRGACGIEAAYDRWLSGEPGGQLLRVDAAGYKRETLESRPARPGGDVVLSIDSRIQETLERLLAGRRGAGAVLDPRNGEVLALASAPAFDPNRLSPAPDPGDWHALLEDDARPLFNRAIGGRYAPGSTFKPVVAIAALEAGLSPQTAFSCEGCFVLGPMRLRCWSEAGHGALDMRKAIEQSCNPYFCNLGLSVGYPRMRALAERFGFGSRTGIALPAETPGLLPDEAWKRRMLRDAWRPGDTASIAVGQGTLLVSPLQMAVYAAALATGGTVWQPRLVLEPADGSGPWRPVRRMAWSQATLDTVRGGLRDVVESPSGTGKRARVPGLVLGGKTGTAEYGPAGRRRKYTWMIAFAPFDDPSAALALLVEDGESGGLTVAPLARRLMAAIFHLPAAEPADAAATPDAGGPGI